MTYVTGYDYYDIVGALVRFRYIQTVRLDDEICRFDTGVPPPMDPPGLVLFNVLRSN